MVSLFDAYNYYVKQAVLFDNDRGFAFAHNPNAVSPFVTWQAVNNDGVLSYEIGHYFSTREKALVDYISRAANYMNDYKVKEKPLPEIPKRLIRFIDSDYRELFQIPDGANINIIYPPGWNPEMLTRQCKYLDECHIELSGGDTYGNIYRNTYHICEFAERMESIGARYEPEIQLRNAEITPFTEGEEMYYKPNREENSTCVGILSGDFGNSGDRFHSAWNIREATGYTSGFQTELQSLIYDLRKGLLKDSDAMTDICRSHPEAKLPEGEKLELYGFRLETETRMYFIRCFAERDSHFAIYAYGYKPVPEIDRAAAIPSSEKYVPLEHEPGDGKKEKSGYTSVLKAIEENKKTPKPPRKTKTADKSINKGDGEL